MLLYQYKTIIKDRINKLNYLSSKIQKNMSGGTKMNVMNKIFDDGKKTQDDINKLKLKFDNYDKELKKILQNIDELDAKSKFALFDIDEEATKKIIDIKNINKRNYAIYDTKYFDDNEILASLKLMYTGLYNELDLHKKENFENEFFGENLANLENNINSLSEKAKEYYDTIKNKNKTSENIINVTPEIINNEFTNNKNLIMKNINTISFNVEKIASVIPMDLNIVIDYGKYIGAIPMDLKLDDIPYLQNGGLTYDDKVNKLFSLSIKLDECNQILQNIIEKKELNEKYITDTNKFYNSIIDLLNTKTTKIYHYVNSSTIKIFLDKIKNNKDDIYVNLRDIFEKIREKIKEDEYIKISNIENEEIQKAFTLFNIIMNKT